MEQKEPLKAIGYWREPKPSAEILAHYPDFPYLEGLPDPQDLVDPHWRLDERAQIVSYLRAGKVAASWNGGATCRLCVPKKGLGTDCLSDGEWIWPQRLEHYIEAHSVSLPDEFVDTMRRNKWRVVGGPSQPFEDWSEPDYSEPDYSYWIAWAAAVKAQNSTTEQQSFRERDG